MLPILLLLTTSQVTVDGEGKVASTPDTATLNFSIISEDAKAITALQKNSETVSNVLAKLDKKNVQTSYIGLRPKYSQKNELIGYTAFSQLTVKSSVVDVGKVIDEVVKAGVTGFSGLSFSVSNKDELLNNARKKAIQDAKNKANLYADEVGMKIDKVVSISETTVVRGMLQSATPDVLPGEQDIKVSVQVVFSLK